MQKGVIFENTHTNKVQEENKDTPNPRMPHQTIKANPNDIKQQTNKLDVLEKNSERVLLRIHTVFPFVLFPDTVVIDENKISIIRMLFFFLL